MAEAAAKEPSMEDILSSIRKIIADEGDGNDSEEVSSETMTTAEDSDSKMKIDNGSDSTEHQVAEPEAPNAIAEVMQQKPDPTPHVPVERDPEPESGSVAEGAGMSLASIAASLQGSGASEPEEELNMQNNEPEPETPVEVVLDTAPETEAVSHVEMAEATPPPQDHSVEIESEPVVVAAAPSEDMKRDEDAFRGALMSPGADNAVSGSFDRLKRSAMDDIEAKTEAILRPMLREWLDENLPSMVEKLVREEIERVARG